MNADGRKSFVHEGHEEIAFSFSFLKIRDLVDHLFYLRSSAFICGSIHDFPADIDTTPFLP